MQKGFSVRKFDYTYSYYMHNYAPKTPEQAKEPPSNVIKKQEFKFKGVCQFNER